MESVAEFVKHLSKVIMRSCGGPHVDRISNLPSNILDNILKYLPVRDAVRTSILSRKWRCQWVTMPHLVFDENFKSSLRKKYLPETIIYHILSLHKGAITKFLDKVSCYDICCFPPPRDRWLFYLSEHYLKDLTLSSRMNEIPLRLFDFKLLRHLYMEDYEISELPPPTFEGFTRLVKLDLLNLRNIDGRLGKFLSKCPMLEDLTLSFHQKQKELLYVVGGVMEEPPEDLDHLTVLKLRGVRFVDEGHASCVLSLIKRSPNLRCLDISMDYDSDYQCDESDADESDASYLKAQHKAHVPFSCLEDVKICGIFGSSADMEFMKILLLRAVALQKLRIESEFSMDISSGMKMLKRLKKFPRASNMVRITFVGTWEDF